jgi:peptidoglycan/xylan/chitin deacetylase (PgdA/CDA1 family)
MNGDLVSLEISDVRDFPSLSWSAGHRVKLPLDLATAMMETGVPPGTPVAISREKVAKLDPTRARSAAAVLRERRLFTDARPTSSRLPISYTKFPGWTRRLAARAIGLYQRSRTTRWADFPGWPLDLSADFAADLAGDPNGRIQAGNPTPVLLSHDLDTGEGLSNLVHKFLDVEERVGARSTNFIVPHRWSIDLDLLDQVRRRGHEVGIHGYDHSNRTPFADPETRQQRLAAAGPLIQRYDIVGYRAPSLLRTQALLDGLADHYRYDSSVPTSGGLFPVPNNGCATARPFRIGKVWEIPLSMPRDGSLRFLGHNPSQILALWMDCADRIALSGGVVNLLTHCEDGFSGNSQMLGVYVDFLDYLKGRGNFAFMTHRQLLDGLR